MIYSVAPQGAGTIALPSSTCGKWEVPLLDAYHITLPMWQMHMKDKDCSHYCSPGAYEVWTYLLTDMLKGTDLRE